MKLRLLLLCLVLFCLACQEKDGKTYPPCNGKIVGSNVEVQAELLCNCFDGNEFRSCAEDQACTNVVIKKQGTKWIASNFCEFVSEPSPTPPPSTTLPPTTPPSTTVPVPPTTTIPPTTDPDKCPYNVDTLERVGIMPGNVTMRDCGDCRKQGYAGVRVNVHATPHSVAPYCQHVPDRLACEQDARCQDPRGVDFWMKHPNFTADDRCALFGMELWCECDKQSDNPYRCHHKPYPNQLGHTIFCVSPFGEGPHSNRGTCIDVNVRVP